MTKADKLLCKMAAFAVIILTLALWSIAHAGNYTVMATWEMNPAPTDLAGFNLRINGDNETMISLSSETRSWSGILAMNDGENVFDVQSIDESGQVSTWSDPSYCDPVPGKPVMTIIILK